MTRHLCQGRLCTHQTVRSDCTLTADMCQRWSYASVAVAAALMASVVTKPATVSQSAVRNTVRNPTYGGAGATKPLVDVLNRQGEPHGSVKEIERNAALGLFKGAGGHTPDGEPDNEERDQAEEEEQLTRRSISEVVPERRHNQGGG